MTDQRVKILAGNLVKYSLKLQKGEKLLINVNGPDAETLVNEVIRECYKAGALPFVNYENNRLNRAILLQAPDELLEEMARFDLYRMKSMDAFLGINSVENSAETSDISGDRMNRYMEKYIYPVHYGERIKNTRWTVMRFPTSSMAQLANTSREAFEDFYFQVCNLDYSKMSRAMDGLVSLMETTDRVRINGKGTDLSFSIKGIPTVKCDGGRNIPDGEVYTAPHKDSVEGVISYNTPSIFQGVTYENIVFTFEKGRIVKAEANGTDRINQVLDTDDGARYIGEFALGVNPMIIKPMKDPLFDEKIMGSFHFTPGNCYDSAPNGNSSSIHWDLVCIQTSEYGGGEIWFDDLLIRKDGRFVDTRLDPLNPENLI